MGNILAIVDNVQMHFGVVFVRPIDPDSHGVIGIDPVYRVVSTVDH